MNGWKVTAIIFIILFIAETILFGYVYKLGADMIEKENECALNICQEGQTYYFDYVYDICYCYENHEIVHEEYIR